jgi:soluble lytic murein transglycosylase
MTIYIPQSIQTSQSVMPAVDFVAPLTPDQASIGTKNIQAFGEGLQQVGKTLLKQDVDAINKAYNLRIQDGVNQLNAYSQSLKLGNKDSGERGYTQYLGGQIFDSKAFEGQSLGVFYNEKFQKKISEISNTLPELARESFLRKSQEVQSVFNGNLTSWENQQTKTYNIDVGTDTVYQGQNLLKNAQNILEADQALKTMDGGFNIIQQETGESNPKNKALMKSAGISDAINWALSNNDLERAKSLADYFKKDIDPDDMLRINKVLSDVQTQQRKVAIYNWSELKGIEAINRNNGGSQDYFYNVILPIEGGEDELGNALISPAGAVGVAQVMPATAQAIAKKIRIPYDPEKLKTNRQYNLDIGQAVFDELLVQFDGDPLKAMIAYNGGPKAVLQAEESAKKAGQYFANAWQEYIPTAEGKAYLEKAKPLIASMSKKNVLPTKAQFVSSSLADYSRQNPNSTPEEIKDLESVSNQTYSRMEQEYNAVQDDLMSQVTSQVLTGSVGKPAEIDQVKFNKLSYENKQKVLKIQNDITSGKNTVTNPEIFNSLWNDPNLGNVNLNNFLGDININDIKALEKRKQDISGKDLGEIRWNDDKISKIITNGTGLNPKNMEFIELRNRISDEIRTVQESTKKTLSGQQIEEIAKFATSDVVYEKTNFFGKQVVGSSKASDYQGSTESILLSPEEEKNAKLLFKVNNGREPTATELKDFVVKYKKGFSQ